MLVATIAYTAWFYIDRYAFSEPAVQQNYGVTFSYTYAESLGLSWQENLEALLTDMPIKRMRVPVYWSELERVQGEFDFSVYDEMIRIAEAHNTSIVFAIGQRVPRWPECHVPSWIDVGDTDFFQQMEELMVKEVVNRYADTPIVMGWQVYNEPYLEVFGECSITNPEQVSRLISYVHERDPQAEIFTTDSGELGDWVRAKHMTDVFGISLYRTTYNSIFGYIRYLFPPSIYSLKYQFTSLFSDEHPAWIISELQMEPWSAYAIATMDQAAQEALMNERIMKDTIRYAERVPVSEVWLWGAEWWYWQKVYRGNDEPWNTAIDIFTEQSFLVQP